MSVEFQPDTLELVQRGATAALLLDAQRMLSDACVQQVLVQIDEHVKNDTMTPERALGLVHEIAAFRRIISRQKTEISRGQAANRRLLEETQGNG